MINWRCKQQVIINIAALLFSEGAPFVQRLIECHFSQQ